MRELGRIFVRVNWLGLTTIALGFALWEVLLRAREAQKAQRVERRTDRQRLPV